jgi:uncharacterized membrane protein YgdD (TMEM256/DUF423 family)
MKSCRIVSSVKATISILALMIVGSTLFAGPLAMAQQTAATISPPLTP